jgi:ABC-type branched-subunit amino acid transport system substrate-binding protein
VDNSADGPVFDALWTAMAKEYGWTEITLPPYPMNATEFGSLITKLKESDADYVVALGDTPVLIALRKQMDAAGYKPKVMDFARGAQLQQFSDALGPLAEGIVIDSYWTPDTGYPGAAELGTRFEEESDDSIGQMVGPSYATGQILMDAITARTPPTRQDRRRPRGHRRRVRAAPSSSTRTTATLQSLLTQCWRRQSKSSGRAWPPAEVIFPLPDRMSG